MNPIAQLNQELARTLVASLKSAKVRHAVLSPGSRNTPMVLAFSRCPDIQLHTILDERSAAFFALGLAKITERPAVLFCTSGSAGAHYLPAIIEARQSNIPLLALTADRPPNSQYSGDWQTIPQQRLFGHHVQHFEDMGLPGPKNNRRARQVMARAIDKCLNPPGPVHINLPFSKPLWDPRCQAQEPPNEPKTAQILRPKSQADSNIVEHLAKRLQSSPRGVISVGSGVPQTSSFRNAVAKVAQILAWPIIAEAASGLRFGKHDQSQLILSYDAFRRSPHFSLDPSLILRFGETPCSKALLQWHSQESKDGLVLVHPHGQWHDPDHQADLLIAADVLVVNKQEW